MVAIEKLMGSEFEPINITQFLDLLREKKMNLYELNQRILLSKGAVVVELLVEDILSNSNKSINWEFLSNYIIVGLKNSVLSNYIRESLPQIKKSEDLRVQARSKVARYLSLRLFGKDADKKFSSYANYRKIKSGRIKITDNIKRNMLVNNPFLVELLEADDDVLEHYDLWCSRLERTISLECTLRKVGFPSRFNKEYLLKFREELNINDSGTLVISSASKLMEGSPKEFSKMLELYYSNSLQGTPFENKFYYFSSERIEDKNDIWKDIKIFSKVEMEMLISFLAYNKQNYQFEELFPSKLIIIINEPMEVDSKLAKLRLALKILGFSDKFLDKFKMKIINFFETKKIRDYNL